MTLKAPLTQRGFFCQKHRRGVAFPAVPSTRSSRLSTIEAMAKRKIPLPEVEKLIELGDYMDVEAGHGWIYYKFSERDDNLMYAAVVNEKAIIIKTLMIRWRVR